MNWSSGAGQFTDSLKALAANGVPVAMLTQTPQLSARGQLAMIVWGDLCGERHIGARMGPIPWRAIVSWCERYRVREAEELIELVQAIDAAWLSNANSDPQVVQRNSAGSQSPVRH